VGWVEPFVNSLSFTFSEFMLGLLDGIHADFAACAPLSILTGFQPLLNNKMVNMVVNVNTVSGKLLANWVGSAFFTIKNEVGGDSFPGIRSIGDDSSFSFGSIGNENSFSFGSISFDDIHPVQVLELVDLHDLDIVEVLEI